MGIDYNSYLGPYLRVTVEVKQTKVDRCADHKFPADAAFCPKCGTAKKDRMTTEEVEHPRDWAYDGYKKKGKRAELNDYICSTSFMSAPDIQEIDGKRVRVYLYTPNRHWDEIGIPKIGRNGSEAEISLEGMDMEGMKKKFAQLFKEEIDYIKQWHGVEVRFGYISYCS